MMDYCRDCGHLYEVEELEDGLCEDCKEYCKHCGTIIDSMTALEFEDCCAACYNYYNDDLCSDKEEDDFDHMLDDIIEELVEEED